MGSFLIIALASQVGCFFVCRHLGHTKNLSWVAWWLLLGWIGAIVLACKAPKAHQALAAAPEISAELANLREELEIAQIRKELGTLK